MKTITGRPAIPKVDNEFQDKLDIDYNGVITNALIKGGQSIQNGLDARKKVANENAAREMATNDENMNDIALKYGQDGVVAARAQRIAIAEGSKDYTDLMSAAITNGAMDQDSRETFVENVNEQLDSILAPFEDDPQQYQQMKKALRPRVIQLQKLHDERVEAIEDNDANNAMLDLQRTGDFNDANDMIMAYHDTNRPELTDTRLLQNIKQRLIKHGESFKQITYMKKGFKDAYDNASGSEAKEKILAMRDKYLANLPEKFVPKKLSTKQMESHELTVGDYDTIQEVSLTHSIHAGAEKLSRGYKTPEERKHYYNIYSAKIKKFQKERNKSMGLGGVGTLDEAFTVLARSGFSTSIDDSPKEIKQQARAIWNHATTSEQKHIAAQFELVNKVDGDATRYIKSLISKSSVSSTPEELGELVLYYNHPRTKPLFKDTPPALKENIKLLSKDKSIMTEGEKIEHQRKLDNSNLSLSAEQSAISADENPGDLNKKTKRVEKLINEKYGTGEIPPHINQLKNNYISLHRYDQMNEHSFGVYADDWEEINIPEGQTKPVTVYNSSGQVKDTGAVNAMPSVKGKFLTLGDMRSMMLWDEKPLMNKDERVEITSVTESPDGSIYYNLTIANDKNNQQRMERVHIDYFRNHKRAKPKSYSHEKF